MNTRSRKALGCFVLLASLAVYAGAAGALGAALTGHIPAWAQLAYFAAAGVVWIFPLKPLFGWMNKGG
jgi:hypothetical protein